MPVRGINMSHRALTGALSSPKLVGSGSFESSLERDLLLLLIFDVRIQRLEVQPVKIKWKDSAGEHLYTPDLLAHYSSFWYEIMRLSPVLYEVKYQDELRQSWHALRPKFKAAYRFAKDNNWKFKIITEKEIRTPYLDNVKFLLPYNTNDYDQRFSMVLDILARQGQMTVQELVALMASTMSERGKILTLIWTMVSNHYLQTDLSQRLNQNSVLWVTLP
jgi:hypothetical protein